MNSWYLLHVPTRHRRSLSTDNPWVVSIIRHLALGSWRIVSIKVWEDIRMLMKYVGQLINVKLFARFSAFISNIGIGNGNYPRIR